MDGHRFVQYRLEVQSSGFKYLITNELGEILNKPTRYIVICDEKVEQSARKIFSQVSDFIVLEVNEIDYSMAQIAQIVEGNNAKILSSYIMSPSDSSKLEVTLKINKIELGSIIRTFERYDYVIKASFQKSEGDDDVQFRYDALMNYLNL